MQLSAGALVQALRPGTQLARFEVRGEVFEVRQEPLQDRRLQRPVRLERGENSLVVMPLAFTSPREPNAAQRGQGPLRSLWRLPSGPRWWLKRMAPAQRFIHWYRQRSRVQLVLAVAVAGMALSGIQLFAASGGWVQGLFVTSALLKGDYVDPTNVVLGPEGGPHQQDAGLITVTLIYSLVGTLLSSALVAVILDQLLLARLGMRRTRRLRRDAQPILLVGGGQLATRVAQQLQRERHVVVRVENDESESREDQASLFATTLEQAEQLLQERSVSAVALLSGQLLADLQDILRLQDHWPEARFALLALREGTGERLGDLLGGASLISPIELGAEVVVATACGERVEGVWRIHGHTLLQVRYRVRAGDTLIGRTVSRLDHGYGVTVLSLNRSRQSRSLTMPAPGTRVAEGDELVVLASLQALRRVERGEIGQPAWLLNLEFPDQVEIALGLTLQQILARHLGLSPEEATARLRNRRTVQLRVDPDCGELLERDLKRQGIRADLQPAAGVGDPGEDSTDS